MFRFVLRIWLDDRPGALGAVASRIGSVRGDLVGIEILERGAGRAIDELLIELPDSDLMDLMVREIMEVDGVDVEDVRRATTSDTDGPVEMLRIAKALVRSKNPGEILDTFGRHLRESLDAEWVCVVDPVSSDVIASEADHPSPAWLAAFLEGASYAEGDVNAPSDLAWAPFGETIYKVVIGRTNRPYRAVERDQLLELSEIAGVRYLEQLALAQPPT